jgi:glyoxylase-like metal-dependent hydrolase (beta-lactamase superfamily II)
MTPFEMIDHDSPSHPAIVTHDRVPRPCRLDDMVGTHQRQFKDLPTWRPNPSTAAVRTLVAPAVLGRLIRPDEPPGTTEPCTVPLVVVVTGTLQKEAWDLKVLPPVEQVRPGLWSIPVPIPNNPLRYVLVYAFELRGSGIALVDAGWNTEEAWSALSDGLAAAGGTIADVRAVMVTHIHPDHYGLAGRVREASGAWIGLHPADAVMLESRYGDTDELVANMFRFLADSGVPDDRLPDLAFASMVMKSMVTMAPPDILFEDGKQIELPGWSLRTIWTPGHSPGHVCLFGEEHKLLISGDHVLPRITPNISVHAQQYSNPLGDYLESLLKVQNLGTEEVLPGHEYRFSDLQSRLEEIITHHADRLEEIEQVISEHPGSTAWEITLRLHWSRPWDEIQSFMQRQANGETLAHCVLLELHDRIRREGKEPARFFMAGH